MLQRQPRDGWYMINSAFLQVTLFHRRYSQLELYQSNNRERS